MLVRVVNEFTIDALEQSGLGYEPYKSGRWVQVPPRYEAASLSKALDTEVVEVHLSTSVDSIEIFISANGRSVRRLEYGPLQRSNGWKKPFGQPRAYEQDDVLKKWLKKKNLLASPDGYEVMDAVLGETVVRKRRLRWGAYQDALDHQALTKVLGVPVPKCAGFTSTDDEGSAWLIELAPDYRGGFVADGNLPRWLLTAGAQLLDGPMEQPKPHVDGRRFVSLPEGVYAASVRRVVGLKNKKAVAWEVRAPHIVRSEKEPKRFWWLLVALTR
ncbi:MAG: hypothetical protein JNM17_08540 [Archangium sp.]|nr:hypothetical protein [Archangium sp.]